MLNLTQGEREFIKAGGIIWCIKTNSEKKWDIYKVTWEYVDSLNFSAASEETATHWAYLLADLSAPEEVVTLHHAIKRRYGDRKYPRVLNECEQPAVVRSASASRSFFSSLLRLFRRTHDRSLAGFRFKRENLKGSSLPCQSGS